MSIKVATHNLCDAFSKPEKIPQFFKAFSNDDDVAVFPEAWQEGEDRYLDAVREDFDRRGYDTVSCLYNDDDGRKDRHGLLMIGRHDMLLSEVSVRFAGRSALMLCVYDHQAETPIDILGLHAHDRSEVMRLEQITALLDFVEERLHEVGQRPLVLAGDLNAMDDSLRAAILRIVGALADVLPKVEPGTPRPQNMVSLGGLEYILRRFASLYSRLGEMAAGDTMKLLRMYGFQDDGRRHGPTATNNFPIADLDRILALAADVSKYTIEKADFTDHKGCGRSLHHPIYSVVNNKQHTIRCY